MPDTTFNLEWDKTGERFYEAGCSRGVLYLLDANNAYSNGSAWNGLISVDENPDGAETTDLWADNIKYASFRTPENHKGNIKAYTYPDDWHKCNGQVSPTGLDGMRLGQQKRVIFGLCYRTEKSNDTMAETDDGYILHLVYGCTVSPASISHSTKNENPDAVEFSWDYESTPVSVTEVTGVTQTSVVELDSIKLGAAKMAAIEAILYGTAASGGTSAVAARMPLPDDIKTTLAAVNS